MAPVGAERFLAAIIVLRQVLDQKPVQYAHILASVATHEGISFQHLTTLTDLSKQTVSRIVDWYVNEGLMTAREIPYDRRNKAAYLTVEGRQLAEKAFGRWR